MAHVAGKEFVSSLASDGYFESLRTHRTMQELSGIDIRSMVRLLHEIGEAKDFVPEIVQRRIHDMMFGTAVARDGPGKRLLIPLFLGKSQGVSDDFRAGI